MSQEQILVVDDEEVMRDVLGRVLTQAGYEVSFAETGLEAVEAARKGSFAAAIVDVMLPEKGGLEVLEELKKLDSELVVLMITAFASMEMAIDAIKKGAFYFVPKPFDNQQLIHVLSSGLLAAAAHRREPPAAHGASGPGPLHGARGQEPEDAPGLPARRAGGALALDDPGGGRERHGQGARGAGDPPRTRRGATSRSWS